MNSEEVRIKTNASGQLYLQDGTGRIVRLYRFREALDLARISVATYYSWVKRGMVPDTRLRDKGRWRVFTEAQVRRLIQLARQQRGETETWSTPSWDQAYDVWRETT